MREPKEPNYSCPYLDSAIEEIENARKIHDSLRHWGAWWKEQAEEIEKEIEEKDKYIAQLEQEIEELKKT